MTTRAHTRHRPEVDDLGRLLHMVETAADAVGDDTAMRAWLASIGDDRAEAYTGRTDTERIALHGAFLGRALAASADLARATRRHTRR